jgi:beta-lactamase class A
MGMKKRHRLFVSLLTGIVLIVISFSAGLVLTRHLEQTTNPLLDPSVNSPNLSQTLINFDPLRQDIKKYLASLNIDHSFYFEYLPNGVNIRDGSEQQAIAASLLKTPVVMDLYKLAEQKKLSLEDTVVVEERDISTDAEYGDPSGLSTGDTISLRNAARIALQKSDNTAISVVRRTVQPLVTTDTDVFESLDISYTVGDAANDASASKTVLISARSYSSILKCLYYTCFLEPADSQEILTYLIGSAGQERLPAGINKITDIKIAHKIGSSLNGDSDCGIFYKPKQPYLVCLIFRGKDTDKSNDTDKYFQKVSKMVYDYVSKEK